jgi:DNA invertase Pin-like site-specific DNA recombinase
MLIGYARVSTDDETLDLQLDGLKAAGCEARRIYTDQVSGARTDRPGLARALDTLREGDTLIVWRLDRLGRSLPHLIQIVGDLKARHIGFRSLTESIDTTTPAGELVFHIFGALAQFERNLIRERTNAGLAAARARGRVGGGKHLLNPKQIENLHSVYQARNNQGQLRYTIADLCKIFNVSRATLYRYLTPPRQSSLPGSRSVSA